MAKAALIDGNELRAQIAYFLEYRNYNMSQLAGKIGLSSTTFYRRYDAPETMSITEFIKLVDTMELTEQEILRIMRKS